MEARDPREALPMRVEDWSGFSQTDEDEYMLAYYATDDKGTLVMNTHLAVALYELLEAELGEHIATMRREKAAYDRATPEERAEVMGKWTSDQSPEAIERLIERKDAIRCLSPEDDWVSDMAHAALLDQQDMIRDRFRSK
jgi:hypothetical protein